MSLKNQSSFWIIKSLSVLVALFFLSEPVVLLMSQYFGISHFKNVFKIFYFLFVFLGGGYFILNFEKLKIVKKNMFFASFFSFGYLLIVTAIGVKTNPTIYQFSTFLVHIFSILAFLFLFLSMRGRGGETLNLFFQKIMYLLPGMDFIMILLVRWNPLQRDFYFNFDSAFLIPLFTLSLLRKNWFLIGTHFLLFYLHHKRGVLMAAVVGSALYFIFLLSQKVWTVNFLVKAKKWRFGFLGIVFMMCAMGFWFANSNLSKKYSVKVFYVHQLIYQNSKNLIHTSHGERLMEVVSAVSQVTSENIQRVIGGGIGWNYFLTPVERRKYTHNSPIYLFLLSGVLGVMVWIWTFGRSFRLLYSADNIQSFFLLFLIISLLHSLTTLNLFTNPLIPIAVSYLFESSKGLDAINAPLTRAT